MDPKGKGMMVNDKEKESLFNEPRDDKPTDSGLSHKKRDGKKKRHIKKIIYYDSDTSSSSPRDDDDEDSSSKKKTVNQNYSFDYSCIPYNSNAHLLSIPLGKPPHFDGEDYSFCSHKMRSHLFSSILACMRCTRLCPLKPGCDTKPCESRPWLRQDGLRSKPSEIAHRG
jgi:hypothetical protein